MSEARLLVFRANGTSQTRLFAKQNRLQSFLRRRSLRPRLTGFFESDLSLHCRAQNFVPLTVGLGHDHPVDLLSFAVLAAGHSPDGACDVATIVCETMERDAAENMEGKRAREMLGERRRKAGECFQKAHSGIGSEFEAEMSQTGFCGLFWCHSWSGERFT